MPPAGQSGEWTGKQVNRALMFDDVSMSKDTVGAIETKL